MTKIVAVCGSLRAGSYTRVALRYVLEAAAAEGADAEMLDLGDPEIDLPLYHPDEDEQGDSEELCRIVREADGVVVGSPVYHGSYSSAFKSFHDYCSFDEYEDTAVGLLATAGGGSYGSTLDHMRSTIRGVHGWVVPHQVGIRSAYEKFDDGEFLDDDLRERTEKLGREVVRHARRFEEPSVADDV